MKILVTLLAVFAGAAEAKAMADYPTLGRAVSAALIEAEALTPDFEAGGTLYQCGTVFAYIGPVTQMRRTGVDVEVYTSATCKLAGMYHTHPRGDAKFSGEDVATICRNHTVGFIKPRNGAIRVFDCTKLSPGGIQAAMRGEAHVTKLEG